MATFAAAKLPGDQIRMIFGNGAPFTATSTTGKAYSFKLDPSGVATEVAVTSGDSTSGTWRVTAQGYCSKWPGSTEHCYTVEKNGRHFDIRDDAGHLVSRWQTPTVDQSINNSPVIPSLPLIAPVPSAMPLPNAVVVTAQPAPAAPVPAPPATLPSVAAATIKSPQPQPVPGVRNGQFRDGSYTGPAADAYYGSVQVRAVIKDGRLAAIDVIQYPSDRSTSRRINGSALPLLQTEVVRAQSAKVNTISGATLTTTAYLKSLNSALQQAR